MMGGTVWFTADTHFGHRLVAGLRGFGNVDDHDAAICEAWVERVAPTDHVWHLGDLTLGKPESALALVATLPGIKHLIVGNHEPCHPMHRQAHKHQRAYMEAFESVQTSARRRVDGRKVLLSHFPYTGDHTEVDRFDQYRLPDKGAILLHGHTHSAIRQDGRQIQVGVDAWGLAPVSIDTLTPMILA